MCEEMEKTWGDSRLAVLAEDEAQRWILGVILITLFFKSLGFNKWLAYPHTTSILTPLPLFYFYYCLNTSVCIAGPTFV